MPTCAYFLPSYSQVISIWHSQEMDVQCFTCIFHGFNSFSKDIIVENYLIIASIEACALCVNFGVINMDLVGLFHVHVVDFTSSYR